MIRFKLEALVAVVLSAAACNKTTTPIAPTVTPPVSVTDTCAGTLSKNGATNFQFSVSSAGSVFATFSSVADPSTVVGLSLGTWNGTTCAVILANDQAAHGTTVTGLVTGIGTLCTRVYDVGKVVDPLDYQVTVVHP